MTLKLAILQVCSLHVLISCALMAKKQTVSMPNSKLKVAIANVLQQEGYISNVEVADAEGKATLTLTLKYFEGKPVIETL